ncbi:MAG: hypothetical protein AB8G16_18330 [Gammaproteobacteria bacterium]
MQLIHTQTHQHLHALHPEAATKIVDLQQILSQVSLDDKLLSLCSEYFDATLRETDWTPSGEVSALEAAVTDVCAQFRLSVADVTDRQIAALNQHLSADEVYNLMYAIYLIEGSKRLELMLEGMTS